LPSLKLAYDEFELCLLIGGKIGKIGEIIFNRQRLVGSPTVLLVVE